MNCARLHQILDAYLDGELDCATTAEVAAHLAQCAACVTLRDQRDALRNAVQAHAPYFKAPATLKPAILDALAEDHGQTPAPPQTRATATRSGRSWWHAAAFAALAALAGLGIGYQLGRPQPDHPLRDAAVASHVAALTPARQLTAVVSSDRHTVKPWFQGKIEIAPPVRDLSGEGFVLLGGRLDHVGDRPAAAVVYQIRKHVINLFVWRAIDTTPEAIATVSLRGFSISTWAAGGLRFAAVSDVDGRDLARFAQRIAAP